MSSQPNPLAYSLMCRCPLKDAAKVKSKADELGVPMSAYVASIIKKDIGDNELTEKEKLWVELHYNANIARRERANERGGQTGKHRKPGRPKKRGRPKGSKNKVQKKLT